MNRFARCGGAPRSVKRLTVELARHLRADLAPMDIRMPNRDGITATRTITAELPQNRVHVLTTFDQDDYVFDALEAGASGFLLKRARPEELLQAIHTVHCGDAVLAPAVTRRVIERMAPARTASAALDVLTARERDVLELMAGGLSNAEIAGELYIEESTVRTHVKHLFQKLRLRDRVYAVIYAYEHGLGTSHR